MHIVETIVHVQICDFWVMPMEANEGKESIGNRAFTAMGPTGLSFARGDDLTLVTPDNDGRGDRPSPTVEREYFVTRTTDCVIGQRPKHMLSPPGMEVALASDMTIQCRNPF